LVWALPFFFLVASTWVAQIGATHSRQKEEEVAQQHQQDREALEKEEEQAREALAKQLQEATPVLMTAKEETRRRVAEEDQRLDKVVAQKMAKAASKAIEEATRLRSQLEDLKRQKRKWRSGSRSTSRSSKSPEHSRQRKSSPKPAVPVDNPKVAAPVGCPPVVQSPMPTSSQWYQPTKGKGGNRTWWNPHGNGAKGKSGGRGGSCFKCGSSDHWSKECPANKEPRDGTACRLLPSHSSKGMSVPVSFSSDFPPCVFVPLGGGPSSVYLGWENEDWGLDEGWVSRARYKDVWASTS
jgi:hypothetical protein